MLLLFLIYVKNWPGKKKIIKIILCELILIIYICEVLKSEPIN